MPPAFTVRTISTLPLAASLLFAGCVSQPTQNDSNVMSPITVSAREYGYARPAVDVVIVERGSGKKPRAIAQRSGSGGSGDLWARLRGQMGLEIEQNDRVVRALERFKTDPSYLAKLSRRAQPYLHLILEEIERRGLPAELALLPEIESRFNPRAVSPKAASGLWQFMPATGKRFGLEQNAWYDGRNDVDAATRAALDYLEWLHGYFDDDWALALAAYNCGEGAVAAARKANRAAGLPVDYWSLDLPGETERYVPKLFALAVLVAASGETKAGLPTLADAPQLEVVDLGRRFELGEVAELAGIELEVLRDLNAGLKRNASAPEGPHRLLMPIGTGRALKTRLAQQEALAKGALTYRVRRGDTLSSIASDHATTVKQLRATNALVGERILVGQELVIPARPALDDVAESDRQETLAVEVRGGDGGPSA